jgi:hypothetical protein
VPLPGRSHHPHRVHRHHANDRADQGT